MLHVAADPLAIKPLLGLELTATVHASSTRYPFYADRASGVLSNAAAVRLMARSGIEAPSPDFRSRANGSNDQCIKGFAPAPVGLNGPRCRTVQGRFPHNSRGEPVAHMAPVPIASSASKVCVARFAAVRRRPGAARDHAERAHCCDQNTTQLDLQRQPSSKSPRHRHISGTVGPPQFARRVWVQGWWDVRLSLRDL